MIQSKEDLMRLALEDPKEIIESAFWIINKDKETVPFIFNNIQNEFYQERTTYDDVLKASQLGLSTEILAIETVKFLLVPNSWSISLSYEIDAAERLLEKVSFFLKHLPPWLAPFCSLSTDNTKVMHNAVMNSKIYVGTPGGIAFARGDTVHYAHLSEISRWKDNGKTVTGIIRAMPDSKRKGDIWIVKETTANGQGNYHHIEWKREKAGKSEFKNHFFPWFKHEQYTTIGAVIDPKTYDEEERHLIARYPQFINAERLEWRRRKINTMSSESGRSAENMFKQEYPSDDEEAFLFSGNPIFPVKRVQEMLDIAKDPVAVGNLIGVPPAISFDETPKGMCKFWDFPDEKGHYIIFADVGQVSDFCSATVVDARTWKMVAKLHAVMNSHVYGTELNTLGRFFNNAMIAVEVNNMGQSTIDQLIDLKYPNLYMRQRLDKVKKEVTEVPGWYTTEKTKALIIGHMQDQMRMRAAEGFIPDKETLGEYTTFIKTETGGMEASIGNYDDQVISSCGAFYILKLHPYVEVKTKTKERAQNRIRKFQELRTKARLSKGRGFRRSL